MPFILVYLFKLSVSLSVVYLFYQFLLRRLTFYNWNRFYLFCYTAISFLIPFINITPVLERNDIADNQVIRFIPAVGNINNKLTGGLPGGTGISSWTYWDWLLFFVLSGIAVMLIRLIVQLMSFKKIISQAQLVSDNKIKLYQVNQTIIPFSFGNSIFINQQLHSDEELTEIMRHEFVHVKQKHTADIIWAELLCILNWYNPFVWMIRKAIRQNLEFIADSKVLQSGIDKKQYQYLLLKVIGNSHFSIASQFNFSSLKKRIAMMNKMKSAGVHLLKFIFILPLIAVLILSFRNRIKSVISKNEKAVFSLSGIVYDNKTELPLAGVLMIESATGIQTKTDSKGFYEIAVPITETEKQEIKIKFTKKGYEDNDRLMEIEWKAGANWSGVGFFSLLANANDGDNINHAFFYASKDEQGNIMMNPGYDFVKNKFENFFKQKKYDENAAELKIVTIEDVRLEQLGIINGDTVPINHKGYIISIKDNKRNCTVVVKDKIGKEIKRVLLTEWNKKKEYYENLYGSLPVEAKTAKTDVIVLSVDTDSTVVEKRGLTYTMQEKPIKKASYKSITLEAEGSATVLLKNGETIKYDLNDETARRDFEEKYGGEISLRNGISPVTVTGYQIDDKLKPGFVKGYQIDDKLKPGFVKGYQIDDNLAPVTIEGKPSVVEVRGSAVPALAPVKSDVVEVGVSSIADIGNVEGNVILDINGTMLENKVRGMTAELKSKGYDFIINAVEYRNDKIYLLKGSISGSGSKKNFEASDFSRFIISDVKKDKSKNEFNFYVGHGSLVWQ